MRGSTFDCQLCMCFNQSGRDREKTLIFLFCELINVYCLSFKLVYLLLIHIVLLGSLENKNVTGFFLNCLQLVFCLFICCCCYFFFWGGGECFCDINVSLIVLELKQN